MGDAAGPNLHKCAGQTTSSPNNDPPVDAMASMIAHELAEAVTDPLFNAWFDADGEEVADKCAFTFGTTFAAPNGSMANVTLGGFDYLIQQEFSNASDSCVMSYSATPDYSLSVSPGSQSAVQGATTGNYTVTVNPTNGFSSGVTLSVTGLPAGATLNAPAPNPASTTATFSIAAGTAATGTYPLTITGTSGALTHTAGATLVVVKPDYSFVGFTRLAIGRSGQHHAVIHDYRKSGEWLRRDRKFRGNRLAFRCEPQPRAATQQHLLDFCRCGRRQRGRNLHVNHHRHQRAA